MSERGEATHSMTCPTSRRPLVVLMVLVLLSCLVAPLAAGEVPPVCQAAAYYIGNVRSRKFHLPTCRTLPAPANRVEFATR